MHKTSFTVLVACAVALASAGSALAKPAPHGASGAAGDPAKGKTVFTANCSACHGATGREGLVGPSLAKEKSRKNFAQTVTWIENPQPPMPKLYPNTLSKRDVENVAAYVQSL